MTNEPTTFLQHQEIKPMATIEFGVDALRFILNGVEVVRLTPHGMEYKGQVVEDAGTAYKEITEFFVLARQIMNQQLNSGVG